MLQTSSTAMDVRLNLFFVRTAFGGGVLGVAGTLSGPAQNGTSQSGVMSLYIENPSQGQRDLVALVAAHEIGHFVGMWHTVEQSGSHDQVLDTAECPANGTNANCPTAGGGYLMHWQALGGSDITNGQGGVIRAHPLMDAAPANPTTLMGPRSAHQAAFPPARGHRGPRRLVRHLPRPRARPPAPPLIGARAVCRAPVRQTSVARVGCGPPRALIVS